MLVVLVDGDWEQNLRALLLRSRSALLLRCRSALLLLCRSTLLLYRRWVLGIWVTTFVLVILGIVIFSSGAGCDGGGGGLCMWIVLIGSGVEQELCSCCGAGVYSCCKVGGW